MADIEISKIMSLEQFYEQKTSATFLAEKLSIKLRKLDTSSSALGLLTIFIEGVEYKGRTQIEHHRSTFVFLHNYEIPFFSVFVLEKKTEG